MRPRLTTGLPLSPGFEVRFGGPRRAASIRALGLDGRRIVRRDVADLAFREAGDRDAPVALLLHGYPNSSYLWQDCLQPIADAGWHAVAPDLPGFGDSDPFDGEAGTWTDHVAALDDFVARHDLAPLALVVHDWGALIGLRWACARTYAIRALAIMGSGFFPDGKWHGLAQGLRTEGQGEQLVATRSTRESFGELLRAASPNVTDDALDEYWKGYEGAQRRAAHLALYRSRRLLRARAVRGPPGRDGRADAAAVGRGRRVRARRGRAPLQARDPARRARRARGRRALPPGGRARARRRGAGAVPRYGGEQVFGERSIQLVRIAGIRVGASRQLVRVPRPGDLVRRPAGSRTRSASDGGSRRSSPPSPRRVLFFGSIVLHELGPRLRGAPQRDRGRGHRPVDLRRLRPPEPRLRTRRARSSASRSPGRWPTSLIIVVCFGVTALLAGADRGARRRARSPTARRRRRSSSSSASPRR